MEWIVCFSIFAGCGGVRTVVGDEDEGTPSVQGELQTDDVHAGLRSGALFTNHADGETWIGLVSDPSAGCEVFTWWTLGRESGDFAYVLFRPEEETEVEVHWQRGNEGSGSVHVEGTLALERLDATEGGGAAGEITFRGVTDEPVDGSARFTVPYCGDQEVQ